jgi:hypothetical protein
VQQIERALEKGVGHGGADETLEAAPVAQEEEGEEGRQQQRRCPGHDAEAPPVRYGR